jgi:HEXXH motif-containing protein
MAAPMFLAVARGAGGVPAVEALWRAEDSKTKLLLREIVDRAEGPAAEIVRHAYDTLAQVSRTSPAALQDVLRHPVVAAWAVAAARADRPAEDAGPARMAYVAAAAAIRSGARHEIVLPFPATPERMVPVPTLGHVNLPAAGGGGPLMLRTGSGSAEMRCGSTVIRIGGARPHDHHWEPTGRIAAQAHDLRIELLLDRASWLLVPGVTAKGRHRIAPADADRAAWAAHVERAWQVLTDRHRRVAAEAAATYTVLTPLASPKRGLNSGTYEDAFGCLSMSPPPSPVIGAAAIAHELRHAQLAAVMDLFALVEPEDGRYYAAWRPDPRPVHGLLHGVYAHLGLSAFWATEARSAGPGSEAEVQLARWRRGAHEGAHTLLDQAKLTPLGRRFVTAALDELHQLTRVPVTAAAQELADREADEHRREWVRANGR